MYVTDVLAALIPAAAGFAFSPLPIIELILVIFSARARVNGIAFLLAVAIPTFILPVMGATAEKAAGGAGAGGMGPWVQIVFGALLLLLALSNLKQYNVAEPPEILASIESMGPGAVALLALGVTVMNPKNLSLLLTAGNTMNEAGLTFAQVMIVAGVFTLIAMLPYLGIIGYQLLGGEGAAVNLDKFKGLLIRNNHKIMFWICALLGVDFLVQGIMVLLK